MQTDIRNALEENFGVGTKALQYTPGLKSATKLYAGKTLAETEEEEKNNANTYYYLMGNNGGIIDAIQAIKDYFGVNEE